MIAVPAMDDARTMLNVLSTRPVMMLAVLGLTVLAMLALDVPQGLPDREILATWPIAAGPYVAAFGLHHLGRSPFLWGALLLAALHLAARRVRDPAGLPRIGIPEAVAILLVLGGLAASGAVSQPSEQPDVTRLRVHMTGTDGREVAQVVEEGAAYDLPGAQGVRTLLFGSADLGPYAVESRPDGALRIHLALPPQPGASPDLRVSGRRPLAHPLPDAPVAAPWVSVAAALLMASAALWVLVLATRRVLRLPPERRPVALLGIAAVALLVLGNPWSGPATGVFPLTTGAAGGPVLHQFQVRGGVDVAAWAGVLPATASLSTFALVARVAAVVGALLLVALVPAAVGRGKRRQPPAFLVVASGVAFGLAGLLLAAHAAFRIPLPIAADDLANTFRDGLLPRIPASLSVLTASLSSGGPYTLSPLAGLLPGIGLLCLGTLLVLAGRVRSTLPAAPDGLRWALLALALTGVLRGALSLVFPDALAAPAATGPVALVSATLAVLALLAARTDADAPPALATLPAVAAAALPFVLAP